MAKKMRQPESGPNGSLVFYPHRDDAGVRLCLMCDDPAIWVWAGDGGKRHFCDDHASEFKDFGVESDEFRWTRYSEKLQACGFNDG